ncbi:MAG TPA: hypothetical protein VMT16_16260 [Thermoanaerobaculia bacterium]|nr:hypothetical protein [Thermoanaerobaculia bacterium]
MATQQDPPGGRHTPPAAEVTPGLTMPPTHDALPPETEPSGVSEKLPARLSSARHAVQGNAAQLGQALQSTGREARLGFWQAVERNPLGIGAAFAGLGILIGLTRGGRRGGGSRA